MGEGVVGWRFKDGTGRFELADPDGVGCLYFPLANDAGMMSSITPTLHGDIKGGQHAFLTVPVCAQDLHNSRSARNFWLYVHGVGAWSVAGRSSSQLAARFSSAGWAGRVIGAGDGGIPGGPVRAGDRTVMEAGFLWHKVTRENRELGVRAEVTNFVPTVPDRVELMRVTVENVGNRPLTITPTAAIPLYCRSADSVRDHRHVTSLLHRVQAISHGIVVRPALVFDERGHRPNSLAYAVLGADGDGAPPVGFFPMLEDFIGEGGDLEWPQVVVENHTPRCRAGERLEGYETVGALRFGDIVLAPGERRSYVIAMGIWAESEDLEAAARKYCCAREFERYLRENEECWGRRLDSLGFEGSEPDFGLWMRWVTLQPMLRRIYGCSFLPHHDYGKGGRGWRDLWQDCLALILVEPERARDLVLNGFAGVRIDGSNATIIGSAPGEFIADRNNIPRVWMDHGAWPFLATRLYIDMSGDVDFLLAEQRYFRDGQLARATKFDATWRPEDGTELRQRDGTVYRGSVLEHILVQHLTSFFNVGEHNVVRLEGADWNDGLDMARERGESVAFTALYCSNLSDIASLLRELSRRTGIREVTLAEEVACLLDTVFGPVDYESVGQKQALLRSYFGACEGVLSGRRVQIPLDVVAADLERKAAWIREHIREREWISNADGFAWFNGYYDGDGNRLEGDHPCGVRMTLTGQVFPIMGGIATESQVRQTVLAVDRYLRDPILGGYRLNTDFGGAQPRMGRCFAFAYGHKENGAIFNHMVVMYANALYRRGFVKEGRAVLRSVYRMCSDFARSRIYPGVPEYFDPRGRGMYHYLTGSASWLVSTVVHEVYGVKGRIGDLVIEPKLLVEEFTPSGRASVSLVFAGRRLHVVYHNPLCLSYGDYSVRRVAIDASEVPFRESDGAAVIERAAIARLDPDQQHELEVELG